MPAAAALAAAVCCPLPSAAQTELGSEDDLTILGVDGTAADPDAEIKGFTVFGSTQAEYTGALAGPGNVVINGVLAVSSGAYFVGNSTFQTAGNIFVNDGSAGQVLSKSGAGSLQWASAPAGDNLGNHIATTTLNMSSFNMVNVSSVNFRSNVFITSAPAAQQGGVYVSTNLFVAGISSATRYYGDGSPLANVTTSYVLGQYFGGGRIFWIDPSGKNVLIAATADQSSSMRWGDYVATGATLDGVHAGKTNTVLISNKLGPGSYAARLCQDYAVSANGVYYDDWYLPSLNELWGLYAQKTLLGIPSNPFWSSTEADSTYAWVLNFSGSQYTLGKDGSRNVRCVRGGPVSAFDHSRDAETARQLQAAPNVVISSETSTLLGAGVRVSTNVYIVGFASATKFFGDGSGLTNLPQGAGDNLGNHVATTTLQMGAYGVNTSSDVTAARYQINGSTVLALLPGFGSLGVGLGAGRINTGIGNSFVGYYAGYSNAAGEYNSFLGHSAGQNNNAGSGNSFVGYQSGYANSAGNSNTFMGYQSGYTNATGDTNSFIGYQAGYSNVSGAGNSFVGYYAGKNSTASNNSFLGYYAGYNTNSGSNNAFFGYNSGFSNTKGSNNAFFGYQSGIYNTTGISNSFIGYEAGRNSGAGSGNSILGYQAGYGSSGNIFSSSTIVGYQAGYSLLNGAADNIFLGWKAGYNVTTGTGNIVIGHDKTTPAVGTNNHLNIGGAVYGDLSAKTIGIGRAAQSAALDVVSTGTAHTEMAQLWRAGDGVIKGSMSATGVMMADKFIGDGSGLANLPAGPGDDLGNHVATTTLDMAGFAISGAGPVTASSATITGNAFSVGGSTLAVSAGNVGVGTDAPAYKLEVKDAGMAGFQVQPQAGYISLRINGTEVARLKP